MAFVADGDGLCTVDLLLLVALPEYVAVWCEGSPFGVLDGLHTACKLLAMWKGGSRHCQYEVDQSVCQQGSSWAQAFALRGIASRDHVLHH